MRSIGCTLIYKSNANDAQIELRSGENFALVIAKDIIKDERVFDIINNEIISLNLKIPIIARKTTPEFTTQYILNEESIDENISQITNLIKEKINEKFKNNSDFIPVDSEQFLNFENSQLACDVYIKIITKKTGDKFLKRLHASDHFTKKEIKNYIDSGLKEFYIPVEQYLSYINMISLEITKSLKNSKNDHLDIFKLNSFAYETALGRLKVFGVVDDITIHLANETIKKITKSIEKNLILTSYLKHLKSNTSSFAFFHCFLIAILSEKLSKQYDWYSLQARDKLIYLSYFHDLSLTNSKLSAIHSDVDIELSSLSEEDKKLVLNHASESAKLIESFKEIPFGLAQLVNEHHGSKKGYGFPEHISTSVSPMAIMFIVIEDFANLFIKEKAETTDDIEKIFNSLKIKYSNPVYTETLLSLQSIFSKLE